MDGMEIMFLGANVLFLYVAVVYLLSLLDNRKQIFKDPTPTQFPSLSVIIPAFNKEGCIARTIAAVRRLGYPKPVEIIVVDDGSTDNTARLAMEERVRVIRKKNGGKASALNAGILSSGGELVACIDADSYPREDALEKMVGYFKDPKVGAVTTSIVVDSPKNILQWTQHLEYLFMNLMRKSVSFLNSIFCTPGPLSIYRRDVFEKIGYFEEGNITEDMEMALRLQANGYKIANSVCTAVGSEAPKTILALFQQRVRWYRGAMVNGWKYSFMFFNPKFGHLGAFIFPINYISAVALIFIILKLLFSYYEVFSSFLFESLGYLRVSIIPPLFNIANTQLFLNVGMVFAIFSFLCFLLSLFVSLKINHKRFSIRIIPLMLVYLFAYNMLIGAAWGASILKELFKQKRTW